MEKSIIPGLLIHLHVNPRVLLTVFSIYHCAQGLHFNPQQTLISSILIVCLQGVNNIFIFSDVLKSPLHQNEPFLWNIAEFNIKYLS